MSRMNSGEKKVITKATKQHSTLEISANLYIDS